MPNRKEGLSPSKIREIADRAQLRSIIEKRRKGEDLSPDESKLYQTHIRKSLRQMYQRKTPPVMDRNLLMEGWREPQFPYGIERLQGIYDFEPISRYRLNSLAARVRKYKYLGSAAAEDWEVAYRYQLSEEREAAVTFPRKDTTGSSERHCAVYLKELDEKSLRDAENLIDELGTLLID